MDDRLDPGLDRVAELDAGIPAAEHLDLLLCARVVEDDLEEEAVLLRLGERVGALVLDRVLGRKHDERVGQGLLAALHGHAPFLHRLQQRRLDLGRRAVDLIGQQHVGEDRAPADPELARLEVVDGGADDVRGEQVGGELDPAVGQVEGPGEGLREQGLGHAGDALEEDVAPDRQGQPAEPHRLLLAHDRLGHLGGEAGLELARLHLRAIG